MGSNVQAVSPVNLPFMGKSFNLYIIHEDICRQVPWGADNGVWQSAKTKQSTEASKQTWGIKKERRKTKTFNLANDDF